MIKLSKTTIKTEIMNETITLYQISLINKNKNKYKPMDNDDFFNNRQTIFTPFPKNVRPQPYNTTLNPWTEHQLANPFLHSNNKTKSKADLKKISHRHKVLSVDQLKNNKILLNFGSKEITQSNKIPRQLPKLNIDKLMRNQPNKKRKTTNDQSRKYLLNSSPKYFSSPNMNKLNYSSQMSKKSSILPSVSRELNITRKIYLLENKINSNTTTPSPIKKSHRQSFRKQEGGDIRRLVEKQWSKKL